MEVGPLTMTGKVIGTLSFRMPRHGIGQVATREEIGPIKKLPRTFTIVILL